MYACMRIYTHPLLEALNVSTEGALWRKGPNVHFVDRMWGQPIAEVWRVRGRGPLQISISISISTSISSIISISVLLLDC